MKNPHRKRKSSKIWTPARRKAFAAKMKRARMAAARGAKKYGGKAVRAVGHGTWAALKAGASEASRQLRNPHTRKRRVKAMRIRAKRPRHAKRASKRNPRRGGFLRDNFVIIAKKAHQTLKYNGRHFTTAKTGLKRFASQAAAATWARHLLRKYADALRGYRVYVAQTT